MNFASFRTPGIPWRELVLLLTVAFMHCRRADVSLFRPAVVFRDWLQTGVLVWSYHVIHTVSRRSWSPNARITIIGGAQPSEWYAPPRNLIGGTVRAYRLLTTPFRQITLAVGTANAMVTVLCMKERRDEVMDTLLALGTAHHVSNWHVNIVVVCCLPNTHHRVAYPP